jgi:hypothetical protein
MHCCLCVLLDYCCACLDWFCIDIFCCAVSLGLVVVFVVVCTAVVLPQVLWFAWPGMLCGSLVVEWVRVLSSEQACNKRLRNAACTLSSTLSIVPASLCAREREIPSMHASSQNRNLVT